MGDILELSPEAAAEQLVARGGEWARRCLDELERLLRRGQLARLMTAWNLSGAGAARVFGVSRQAFAKWLRGDPPADRSAAIADLDAATELLVRYLKRERIPAVVRRPAPALANRSLLDIAAAGETREVLAHVREMFDLRRVQP